MNESKLSVKGLLIWGICALFYLYEFFIRTVLGTYQHPFMKDLGIDSLQFSLISSTIFFLVYGTMQIPVGLIVDHIGLKKSLLIGALACALAALGFSTARSIEVAFAFRLFMGFGASFGFVTLLMSVHDWMPHKYIAIFMGLSQFIGTLGPMVAAGPIHTLAASGALSWRTIFQYLSGFGLVLAVLVLFFVENNKEKAGKYIVIHKPEKIITTLKKIFSRLQPWSIAVLSACLYFTVEYLSDNEGRSFLQLKGISSTDASYMLTISWLGFAISAPIIGFASDYFERRNKIMKIFAAIGLVSIAIIVYNANLQILRAAFFFLGASASSQSIAFANMAEQLKKQFVAVGFGLNNAMITTFSAVMAPLLGFLLDVSKSGTTKSLSDYMHVFNVLILISVVGLLISTFIVRETYCKSLVGFTILKPKLTTQSA